MMLVAAAETGSLAPLVEAAGWLMSASIAIGLTWRRRAKWEPIEEDVGQGPARVGGLVCAVGLALLWTQLGDQENRDTVLTIAIVCAATCVVALLGYGYLIATHVYERLVSTQSNTHHTEKIIGGFWLSPAAVETKSARRELTIQNVLTGAAYDPDLVWSRASRALAKAVFVLAYIVLTASGTLALSAAAMLLIVPG